MTNFQAADSFNKRLEKDVSTGNIPHIFSTGFVYEMPFGRGRMHSLNGWRNTLGGGWQLGQIRSAFSPAALLRLRKPPT